MTETSYSEDGKRIEIKTELSTGKPIRISAPRGTDPFTILLLAQAAEAGERKRAMKAGESED